MEKTTIGYNAGAIWDKLRETGRITIAELARKLNMAAGKSSVSCPLKPSDSAPLC